MKLIIDTDYCPVRNFDDVCSLCNCECISGEALTRDCHLIRNGGTPYNPTGDCISREALKKEIQHLGNANPSYWNKCDVVDRQGVLDEIDNAQAVDLWQMRQEATENALKKAEVLYGRPKRKWIECRSSDHWKCDECGHPAPLESRDCEWLSNFCPNCGADMRKGGKEE